MKLAFSKPTTGQDEQRLLFNRYRAAGYDGLQLKGSQYGAYLDRPAEFRAEWDDDPASTSALIAGGTLDPAGLAGLRSTIAFANEVGSERIVFCHGISRAGVSDSDIAEFARTLSAVGREAADQGVALSLHHHYDNPVMHRHDFDVFFDAADPGTIGLTIDTAHLAKSGVDDISGLVLDFASVIDNFHLKDFANGEFRLLGEGTLDLDKLFATLQTINFTGWLCVDEETPATLANAMDLSIHYLQQRNLAK